MFISIVLFIKSTTNVLEKLSNSFKPFLYNSF